MTAIDYLIVGAGLTGATCARLLSEAGRSVQVIERRSHIGGNCYDEPAGEGAYYVNRYGGHIFHTNSERIWQFVSRFSDWRRYEHRVKACAGGRVYSFPPNRLTLQQLDLQPGEAAEQTIRRMFFEGYTAKQWGRPLADVPASVLARVPYRDSYDDRYFTDRYQAMPENGYTAFVASLLSGLPVETNTDFRLDFDYWRARARQVIYTGPLDSLLGYEFGRLEYRSLAFRTAAVPVDDYQGCATMNYTDASVPYTRIMEWQYFGHRQGRRGETVVTYEYPQAEGEPYYPVETDEQRTRHRRYADAARAMGILPAGRLGSYRYLNMDQAIGQAMRFVEKECE